MLSVSGILRCRIPQIDKNVLNLFDHFSVRSRVYLRNRLNCSRVTDHRKWSSIQWWIFVNPLSWLLLTEGRLFFIHSGIKSSSAESYIISSSSSKEFDGKFNSAVNRGMSHADQFSQDTTKSVIIGHNIVPTKRCQCEAKLVQVWAVWVVTDLGD